VRVLPKTSAVIERKALEISVLI